MTLSHHKIESFLLQVIDSILACGAFALAFFIRTYGFPQFFTTLEASFGISSLRLEEIGGFGNYTTFLIPLAVFTPLILFRMRFYLLRSNQTRGQVLNLTLQASLLLFMGLLMTQFILKEQPGRSVFLLFVPLNALILSGRFQLYRAYRVQRSKSKHNLQNALLVSDRKSTAGWHRDFEDHPEFGLHIVREIQPETISIPRFVELLHEESVRLVIFDIKYVSFEKVVDAVRACEDEGIEVWLATGLFETRVAQAKVAYFIDRPVMIFQSTPDSSWQILAKELMDRLGALVLLFVFALPMLLIALLIKFLSPGPVLFRQHRSGHYSKSFIMYKFRSMVTNAEQLHDELARLNEMSGPVFKVTQDPRVTPLGLWLRKTSLDELPQLFNVLKGEMSLVGPRPLPTYETDAISENTQRRRLSVKPGLTCYWQIRGRNQVTSFQDWVKMDLEYIDNWSIWLDLKILLCTIPTVLWGHGAK